MNRLMVPLGFGSLLALLVSTSESSAEIPRVVYPDQAIGGKATDALSDMLPVATANTIPSRSSGSSSVTWHRSFEEGWAEAKSRGLPMVIFITSDHCRYCDAMKSGTWCDDSIRKCLADDFVAIELSPTRNASTLKRIKVPMFPMTLIGVPEGKITEHRVGYQPAAAVKSLLRGAKQKVLRR